MLLNPTLGRVGLGGIAHWGSDLPKAPVSKQGHTLEQSPSGRTTAALTNLARSLIGPEMPPSPLQIPKHYPGLILTLFISPTSKPHGIILAVELETLAVFPNAV
jgi:hypothetical protein